VVLLQTELQLPASQEAWLVSVCQGHEKSIRSGQPVAEGKKTQHGRHCGVVLGRSRMAMTVRCCMVDDQAKLPSEATKHKLVPMLMMEKLLQWQPAMLHTYLINAIAVSRSDRGHSHISNRKPPWQNLEALKRIHRARKF
jgi:hypothetical protein